MLGPNAVHDAPDFPPDSGTIQVLLEAVDLHMAIATTLTNEVPRAPSRHMQVERFDLASGPCLEHVGTIAPQHHM